MRLWLKLGVFFALLFGGLYGINKIVPAQHLPWRQLNPELPLGLSTKTQLLRLSLSPSKSCMNMASAVKPLIHSAGVKLAPDAVNMQCPLSIGSYLWTREINKIAMEELGSPVTAIIHFGTYSCRKQNGNGSGQWSEHAFANAWDVAGFELSDGRVISVKTGWQGKASERKFLRRSRKVACQIFNVTLSPDYNAAHADHFHFDMGSARSCR